MGRQLHAVFGVVRALIVSLIDPPIDRGDQRSLARVAKSIGLGATHHDPRLRVEKASAMPDAPTARRKAQGGQGHSKRSFHRHESHTGKAAREIRANAALRPFHHRPIVATSCSDSGLIAPPTRRFTRTVRTAQLSRKADRQPAQHVNYESPA